MATNNKREVELVIGVETTGQQAVKALSDAVSNLAKEGNEATPEFQKLAAQLDAVAQQQDAIDTFVTLRRQVADVATEMKEATAAVDRLGSELPTAAAATRQFAEAQAAAQASLDQTKNDLKEMRAAQKALQDEYQGAARRTDEFRTSNEQLKVTIRELRTEVSAKRAALKEAADATKEAAAVEKTLSAGFNASVVAARDLSSELARMNGALDRSRETLNNVGIETTSLNAAQQKIRQSFGEIRAETEKQAAALERNARATQQLVEAERLLQSELEIQSASKREAIALEEQRAAAARESADALRAAAAKSAAALEEAFAKTGVRSAQAVEREIKEINEALNKLAFNARVSGAEFDRAFDAGQARIAKLRGELEKTPGAIDKTNAAVGYLKQQFSQLAAIYGGIELARAFIDANVQMETLRRSLSVVTGSTKAAADQIQFLQTTANKAGISVGGITDAFVRFNASAATAGVPLQTVNQLFASVTAGGAKLGLSTERVALSLEALGQIAAKGTVSMEELRGQLGDSFPGALSIAAKALGVTQGELVKLVESGQVLAEDFLPAFGQAVEREFGKTAESIDGIAASWNRFKNVLTSGAQALGDGAIFKALMGVLVALGGVIRDITVVVVGFDRALAGIGRTVGLIAAALTGNIANFKAFKEELSTIWSEAGDDIQRFKDQAYATSDAMGQVGGAATATGQQMQQAAIGVNANAKAQAATATAAGTNAQAQTSAGNAAAAAGTQAAGATQNWYKLLATMKEATTAAENATQVAIKQAEADKLRGDTMVRVAELSRDQVRVMGDAALAATTYAASAQAVADARAREAAVALQQLEATKAELEARGGTSDALKKQIADLTLVAEKKAAEAAKSSEAAAAARQEAAERQVASQTYRDNADALDFLRKSAEDARATLAALVQLEQEGQATAAQVTAARLEEARAMALYSDAIQDVAARTAALNAVRRAEADQVRANLSVEMARAQASEQFAKTYQNEGLLRSAQISQRRIEIQMIQASAQAIVAEQQAVVAKAQADAAELERSGQMNETKRLEIQARIQAAQAKITESEATKSKISAIESEISAIIRQGEVQQQVGRSNIGIIESETQARIRNADAIKAQQKATEDKAAYDRQHTVSDNTGLSSLQQKMRDGTLSADDLKVAQTVYDVAKDNLTSLQQSAPGTFSFAGRQSIESDFVQARMILEALQSMGLKGGSSTGTTSPSDTSSNGRTNSSGRTVNINLNGSTTSVKVASDADARNMENLLRNLTTGASTSN